MTTPHPDSHLGRVAKYRDLEAGQLDGLASAPEPPGVIGGLYVRTESPELTILATKVMATGGNAVDMLLPQDPARRRAVVITLDEPVVIASSKEQAQDPRNASNAAGLAASGLVLPVNTPLVIESRGVAWVAATSSTPTRVSVLAEKYEQDA